MPKFEMKTILTRYDGVALTILNENKVETKLTLRTACCEALMVDDPQERSVGLSGEEITKRCDLATRIYKQSSPHLSATEVVLILRLMRKRYGTAALGAAQALLEPPEPAETPDE